MIRTNLVYFWQKRRSKKEIQRGYNEAGKYCAKEGKIQNRKEKKRCLKQKNTFKGVKQ